MTMAEAEEIFGFWQDNPPVYVSALRLEAMVGHWLGVKRPRSRPVESRAEQGAPTTLAAALAEIGPGFVKRDVHEGLDAVVLDFAELKRRAAAGRT